MAPLPPGIVGHFGPELRLRLAQYHRGQVTVSRNPAHPKADTVWGRRKPYSLDELSSVIPFNGASRALPKPGSAETAIYSWRPVGVTVACRR